MQRLDATVTSHIWDSVLPVQVTLDSSETISTNTSNKILESVYTFIPRCAYLHFIIPEVQRLLRINNIDSEWSENDVWFDYNGVPLKWHHPVGLIYDQIATNGKVNSLPWQITVHFQNFPSTKIPHYAQLDPSKALCDMFMSMIKEADFIRNGSMKKVMALSKNDQTQLWNGLNSHHYKDFWDINTRLVTNESTIPKYVPLRCYLPDQQVIQDLVPPLDDNLDREYSIGDVLKMLLSDQSPELSTMVSQNTEIDAPPASFRAVLHGFPLQLDTPILWLSQNCSYPDNFLHIVIAK
ncbi:autophagy protein Apg5-domain-containing protein [Phlyctochytrium arcticum]|nr:autophagy protein Apg5-domain-containing protein [Phlyctochytrium arcticum]